MFIAILATRHLLMFDIDSPKRVKKRGQILRLGPKGVSEGHQVIPFRDSGRGSSHRSQFFFLNGQFLIP